MAHFAKINEENIVETVIVICNTCFTEDVFPQSEPEGQEYIANELKLDGTWLQTSFNNNFRVRYAGIGMKYDSVLDVFLYEQPFPSWTLDNEYNWEPPVPYPEDFEDVPYDWDEENHSWVPIT